MWIVCEVNNRRNMSVWWYGNNWVTFSQGFHKYVIYGLVWIRVDRVLNRIAALYSNFLADPGPAVRLISRSKPHK